MPAQPEKTELEKKLEAELAAQQASTAQAPRENGQESNMNSQDFYADEEPRDVETGEDQGDEDLPEMISPGDVQALIKERDELIKERDELKEQLLRARAEFDNYRKRTIREAERARQRAAEALLRDLLPVADNLELALQHAGSDNPLTEGVALVVRQLHDVLRRAGVEPIPSVGEPFNPMVHEAVMHAPSEDVAENSVAHEFQRGYRLGDYVLRPSKVSVSKGSPEEPSAG